MDTGDRTIAADAENICQFVLKHIMKLKTVYNSTLASAEIVLIIENNLAFIARHLWRRITAILQQDRDDFHRDHRGGEVVVGFYQDPISQHRRRAGEEDMTQLLAGHPDVEAVKIGFMTTNERKIEMVTELQWRLNARALVFHESFFTLHPTMAATDMREKFFAQLFGFQRHATVSKRRHNHVTYTYSGKSSGGRTKDDLVMAILIANLAADNWLMRPEPITLMAKRAMPEYVKRLKNNR